MGQHGLQSHKNRGKHYAHTSRCSLDSHLWIMEWIHLKRHVCMDPCWRVCFCHHSCIGEWMLLTDTNLWLPHQCVIVLLRPQQAKRWQNFTPACDHKSETFSRHPGTRSRQQFQDSCRRECPSSAAWTHSSANFGWWASPQQSPSCLFPLSTFR